jgi:hypothetical protein
VVTTYEHISIADAGPTRRSRSRQTYLALLDLSEQPDIHGASTFLRVAPCLLTEPGPPPGLHCVAAPGLLYVAAPGLLYVAAPGLLYVAAPFLIYVAAPGQCEALVAIETTG